MRRMLWVAVAAAVAVVGLVSCTPPTRYELVVTSGADAVDVAPGDGVCEVIAGVGECTLRAAIQEADALVAAASAPVAVVVTLTTDVTLALAGADEDLAATGDLDVDARTSEVHVRGGGHRVDAAGLDRAFDIHTGTVLLDHVMVTGGRSAGPGGGMRTAAGTSVGVAASTFVDNRAVVPGACFTAYFLGLRCVLGGPRYGGTDPIGGGAIASGGRLVVLGSTFESNAADAVDFPCEVGSPQWATCPASWGGAIQSTGELVVSLSTFVGNEVVIPFVQLGGDVARDLFGSAIHATGSSQVLSSTVVAGSRPVGAVDAATVRNSIVVSPSCGPPVIDGNRNLRSPDPCGSPAPTGLGDLADNGGPTRTVLPDSTSPAIDAVAWSECLGTTVDQRGAPRSADQPCDVGAVERQPSDP